MTSSNEAMHVVELFKLHPRKALTSTASKSGRPVVDQLLLAALDGHWPKLRASHHRRADARHQRHSDAYTPSALIEHHNLFRTETGSLNNDDVAIGPALASIATIAILQHRNASDLDVVNAQLLTTLDSRIVIEQAQGHDRRTHTVANEPSVHRLRSAPATTTGAWPTSPPMSSTASSTPT